MTYGTCLFLGAPDVDTSPKITMRWNANRNELHPFFGAIMMSWRDSECNSVVIRINEHHQNASTGCVTRMGFYMFDKKN